MKIKKNKKYKIKGKSSYFATKYGTPNPFITIECSDIEVWGKSWAFMEGNPAAILFGMRVGLENISGGDVYYGHVSTGEGKPSLGELVYESELEEVL